MEREPAAIPDVGGWGNHEYGNRVGVFRIFNLLDRYGITPTLALDKTVADHYPLLVGEGQKRGAEFIAHGLSRRRLIHIGISEDAERDYIRGSIAAIERATGKPPIGWSGPDFQESPNTPHRRRPRGREGADQAKTGKASCEIGSCGGNKAIGWTEPGSIER